MEYLGEGIKDSIGIDPLAPDSSVSNGILKPMAFAPPTSFESETFDAVVMLATLEHIEGTELIATEFTLPSCPRNTIDDAAGFCAVRLHSRAVLSSLPVIAQRAFGLIATE